MTTTQQRPNGLSLSARRQTDLYLDQVTAIDAWVRSRRAIEPAPGGPASREMRLDLVRREDVLGRQHEALLDWTERQLSRSVVQLHAFSRIRAVIGHRNEWFRGKLASALRAGRIDVVAELDNGAEAVGISVAEQPDLMLVEGKLLMISGAEVIREVSLYSPLTHIVAHVDNEADVSRMLDAGARSAYTRRTSPVDIAADLCALMRT